MKNVVAASSSWRWPDNCRQQAHKVDDPHWSDEYAYAAILA